MARGVLEDSYEGLALIFPDLFVATTDRRSQRARFGLPFRSNLRELSRTDLQDAEDVSIEFRAVVSMRAPGGLRVAVDGSVSHGDGLSAG